MAVFAAAALFGALAIGQTRPESSPTVPFIRIEGPEQSDLDPTAPDGGLPPVWGVKNFQVFRACRLQSELPGGAGYTYNHHVDLACWKGRLYLAWGSGEKDEDTWPAREMYSTSTDGASWSAPAELFPQGTSAPLRMYFFHTPNGRMLAIAALRLDHEKTTAEGIGPLVVREIRADHSLGEVHTLQGPKNPLPMFDSAADAGFVQACRQLLADSTYLSTQDFGKLLNGGAGLGEDSVLGKATSFFHRRDGALVGIAKKGLTIVSTDQGKTWSAPATQPTLVTGMAKVWGQRTSDGEYALVYNPSAKNRFPLVVVHGDDGQSFRDMRVVHGEFPPLRYPGAHKNPGPQYVRGISEWADDGSWRDQAIWVAYSVNKEDIWVSRIPLPLGSEATPPATDDFDSIGDGFPLPGWNTYLPKWSKMTLMKSSDDSSRFLRMENRDPYDGPRAQRMFPQSGKIDVTLGIRPGPTDKGCFEISLLGKSDEVRPVQLLVMPRGLQAIDGSKPADLGDGKPNEWINVKIQADCATGKYSVDIDGRRAATDLSFAMPCKGLQRFSLCVLTATPLEPTSAGIPPESDHPVAPVAYDIRGFSINPPAR